VTDIRALRLAAGMTHAQAGAAACATERTWQDWESGRRAMPEAAREVFMLRTGQHPTHRLAARRSSIKTT